MDKKWLKIFTQEQGKTYYKDLSEKLEKDYKNKVICPPKNQIFRAFELVNFDEVKVVIIGQDPYYGLNQADGLAFSVNKSVKIPKSLVNIFKELVSDIKIEFPKTGDLTSWAKQGVLLLNTVLTVELNKPLSHSKYGWQNFTNRVIEELSLDNKPKVFILWGNDAFKFEKIINSDNHLILKSAHPSPLSAYRGFFGSKPFSKTNSFLQKNNLGLINWFLD